jgi:hypothetical protein
MHTLISLIIFYKLWSVAAPRHLKLLLLENRIYIVALTPDLQRVLIYNIILFLYRSSTTKLILSLILLKESYRGSKALTLYRKSLLAMWYYSGRNLSKVTTRISTSANNFGLVQNNSTRPIIFTR